MRSKIQMILIALLWYTVIIFDIICMIVLSSNQQYKEMGLYISIFILERLLQMILGAYFKYKSTLGIKDKRHLLVICASALFFVDFAITIKNDISDLSNFDAQDEERQHSANSLESSKKQKIKKPKQKYPILLQLRTQFQIVLSILINLHGMFRGNGANGFLIIAIILQAVLTIFSNQEQLFEEIEAPTIKEQATTWFISLLELITKICFYGFFAIQAAPKGVYILFIVEFFLGFFTELFLQCFKDYQQLSEKENCLAIVKNTFKDKNQAKLKILYPILLGLQLAFYGKIEDFLIERIDKKEKIMKTGNLPILYRQFELTLLFLFSIGCLSRNMPLINSLKLIGYFPVGVITFLIVSAWNIFFVYKAIIKKEDKFYLIKDTNSQIQDKYKSSVSQINETNKKSKSKQSSQLQQQNSSRKKEDQEGGPNKSSEVKQNTYSKKEQNEDHHDHASNKQKVPASPVSQKSKLSSRSKQLSQNKNENKENYNPKKKTNKKLKKSNKNIEKSSAENNEFVIEKQIIQSSEVFDEHKNSQIPSQSHINNKNKLSSKQKAKAEN